jgi:hypothetical protein
MLNGKILIDNDGKSGLTIVRQLCTEPTLRRAESFRRDTDKGFSKDKNFQLVSSIPKIFWQQDEDLICFTKARDEEERRYYHNKFINRHPEFKVGNL